MVENIDPSEPLTKYINAEKLNEILSKSITIYYRS